MVQGAMSSAGKSLLVTALCRIFTQRGIRVAPFKAQNMSNNAAVCADGGEIGRAQYTQALACGLEPSVFMNPVLLKPQADMHSQVIVNGRVWETLPVRSYYERKRSLWEYVTTALNSLREQYELIIIEGAGSPVELNLKRGDIVNMAVAKYASASVLLAGDIDRGGIFAQLLGTLMLLEPDERNLVKGLLVNKFRGDPTLFEDGIEILETRGGVPVLGVIPYIKDLAIPEEDAVAIESKNRKSVTPGIVDIAVIALPRIANFDDFDPLAAETGVSLRYVSNVNEVGTPDAIILPGTKSTMADLMWLRERGLHECIVKQMRRGAVVVGICGGYQMLGERISDPQHVESKQDEIAGLGLLPIETTFLGEKATFQSSACIVSDISWLAELRGQPVVGYEIHMGSTLGAATWLNFTTRNQQAVDLPDGSISPDGRIWGCYLHGLFANENLRRAWLHSLGWNPTAAAQLSSLDAAFDYLANSVEAHLNMQQLEEIIG
ncbi:MAG: cobyric acid synthase [Blastochloris sp.]|nr:cobyric acid synthase [Blastochloris sp.]